ncbi:tRNA-U20-dihydrouridine synthase [Roseovarius nanhaiticus]|uniref:tRNA-dihydrouridine synthase n=2 Tax=Roseovarius nanhaiticus TaxID=573024 RepID=A0A1N7GEA2_9RHOB|nr:tRNA-U20-dihydrouridine synthase [Roseovarius nanhaiticus]SIS10868.1 tRNA-U20-dihydrouridine synthase [Roseovarius nanhaiticus]
MQPSKSPLQPKPSKGVRLGDMTLDPPVLLAPMAGITDLPFRNLVSSFGAGLVVSEMIASQEMVQSKPSARDKAELGLGAAATAVQIAGCEAHWMAEAARMAEADGARIIDINMGCPAKKVTRAAGSGAAGSALMRTPDHACRLIEAVAEAVRVPVTLKMRLGWDDALRNAPQIARMAEAAGIAMVTIHGRTRCQFYKGRADWSAIREVRDAVRIPVIANGDIVDPASARQAMSASGGAGVMVGRGAQGRPWILAQIAHELGWGSAPRIPQGNALTDMISEHYEAMLAFYGKELGARVARKHLGWYLEGADPGLRRLVLTADGPDKVLGLIPAAVASGARLAA